MILANTRCLPWVLLSEIICGLERITPTVRPLPFRKLLGCHLPGMTGVSSRRAISFFFSLEKHNWELFADLLQMASLYVS